MRDTVKNPLILFLGSVIVTGLLFAVDVYAINHLHVLSRQIAAEIVVAIFAVASFMYGLWQSRAGKYRSWMYVNLLSIVLVLAGAIILGWFTVYAASLPFRPCSPTSDGTAYICEG